MSYGKLDRLLDIVLVGFMITAGVAFLIVAVSFFLSVSSAVQLCH